MMMHEHEYAAEKLRQFESERPKHGDYSKNGRPRRKRPAAAPIVSAAGRAIKRVGVAMESWATTTD
jgi:hypothetical protein